MKSPYARALGYTAAALRDGGGFTNAHELLCGGYTGTQLRESGFSLRELMKFLTTQQLLDSGFASSQLLAQGKRVHELKLCDVPAQDLRLCGVSCVDMLAAGYDARQLISGGFTVQELQAAGHRLVVRALRCVLICHVMSFSALQMRGAMVDAETLWKSGVFSAHDMREAGYPCEQLMLLGCSERQLRDAGDFNSKTNTNLIHAAMTKPQVFIHTSSPSALVAGVRKM
jgi:hypothetical protein